VNTRYVIRQLGSLMVVLSLSILVVTVWSAYQCWMGDALERQALQALLISIATGLVIALICYMIGRRADDFLGSREALLLVALSWLAGAALSAMPYWLWAMRHYPDVESHPFTSFVSCYFEAMSGLTTTGATVLSRIDTLPRGLLLWRSLTHWLGGLGIVVLFVAVLPTLGVGGKKLFQVEAPGPTTQGVRPRIRSTARILWMIYLGMTIAQVLILHLFGMNWFDSVCHTFATLATGGFSTQNASVGQYNSVAIDITIIVFMVLAGANFGIYYQLIRRRFSTVWTDPEFRLYLAILFIATLVVSLTLVGHRITSTTGEQTAATFGQALRYGAFQAVSIQTTTGYCTANYEDWGFIAKAVLLGLMFVGGSAGSTGGGIKVIRILIAFKVMLAEVQRVFSPNWVRPLKVGKMSIDPDLRLGTLVYALGIIVLFVVGTVLLMLIESGQIDFTTAASAAAATLNNVGPGLVKVGAVENYGWFSAPSLVVMSLLMLLGRLEVYAILVLFVPRFWRS